MKSHPENPMSLETYLDEQRKRIEARLRQLVPEETEIPSAIHRALPRGLVAGGKRMRSIFCLEAARMVSDEPSEDMEAISCSLEMVHAYSLIHDDLPALDNDDYRSE